MLNRSKGGQFIAHVKALLGIPYDGHTLEAVISEIETQIGASLSRIVADRGYRGHNAPPHHKLKVFISGHKCGVNERAIRPDLRRPSAIDLVIGRAKAEHRMGRNFPKGAEGDAANVVLAAAGYDFRRLLAWLAAFWRVLIMRCLPNPTTIQSPPTTALEPQRTASPLQKLGSSVADSARKPPPIPG